MARLKFLVFALVAVGLWAYHLTMVGPMTVAGSVDQAQSALAGAGAAVAVGVESQRSLVNAAAYRLSVSSISTWNAGPKTTAKVDAPSADRFANARAAVNEVVPSELREQVLLVFSNESGVLAGKGSEEPATTVPEGVDLAAVVQAGPTGVLRTVHGVPYQLLAVPLIGVDKTDVKSFGSAVVGVPALPDAKQLEVVSKALGLKGLAIAIDGKVALQVGDKASVDEAFTKLKPATTGALTKGPVRELGPLALPLLVENPVHSVGARQALNGTPFEVVGAASSKAALDALAGYQVFALSGFAALLLLTLVVTIIIGGAVEESGPAMVLPPPMPVPPKREESMKPTVPARVEPPAPAAPEASPDDFDFPPSNPVLNHNSAPPPAAAAPSTTGTAPPFPTSSAVTGAARAHDPEPTSDPFAAAAPPPASKPPPPVATSEAAAFQPSKLHEDDEEQRTVAYPAFKPPSAGAYAAPDPFAAATNQSADLASDDNVDATRVAAVPAELIKATRAASPSGMTSERPAVRTSTAALPKVASVPPAANPVQDEEKHFQEVFRDFVTTREKCREPADGLTFEKFKGKLLKNKEQLVAKYQCKTVRFQVYVKDGKAALKATPVKD